MRAKILALKEELRKRIKYQDDEDDKSILCGTDVTNLLVL